MEDKELLIGKKIISPSELSDDKENITLRTENSIITLTAVGECCSSSWIEHFDEIEAGETITEVIEKDIKESDDGCSTKYFYEIVTDKGNHTVELRNESNGYYGGHIEVNEKLT